MIEQKTEVPSWEDLKIYIFALGKKAEESDKRIEESDKRRKEEWDRKMAEKDKRMAEEDKRRKEEWDRKMAESDERHKHNLELIDERFQKERKEAQERFDRNMEKMESSIERSNKASEQKLNKLETMFNTQWSRLTESLVEGKLVSLLNKRGIEVLQTSYRVNGFCKELDKQYEYDIVAHNGDTVVIVEVKTTLRVADVKDFLKKMALIRITLKRYQNPNVKFVGAVAYISKGSEADVFAENKGLFVIKAVGDSAIITNRKDFLPKIF